MHRMFVLLVLSCLVVGCATSSENSGDSKDKAVRCARAWKAKGFDFDPNKMTCEQMYARAQTLRNAAYWKRRGYVFNADTMTAREMDRKAAELRRQGIRHYRDPSLAAEDVAPKPREGDHSARDIRKLWLEGVTIKRVRARYPQYDDMNDVEFAHRIHAAYFSEMSYEEFARHFLAKKR
ncbi:MAG: hypothetical protein JW741_03930 [Sedimentisphaerales bacterium]|nr:hypothetical protein [Sedimentisphaerales bacterium]